VKPEKIAGKLATQELIKGIGGLEAGAGFCRVGKSVLGDAQNINCGDRWLPIDVVADLEPLAREREGWPHVTRWLCQQMGGTFVALPRGGVGREDLLGSVGRLAKEHGDIATAICGALADGSVSAEEAATALVQVQEAQAVLAALAMQLTTIMGDR